MKRKIIAALAAIALTCSMAGCQSGQVNSEAEVKLESGSSTNISEETFNVTKEQMLEDYDYLWSQMKESYPFWGVFSRNNPEDPDYYEKVIEDYRNQLEEMVQQGNEASYNFLYIVASSLYEVCGNVGHVSIINSNHFRDLDVYNKHLAEMPELKPWVEVISKPEVIEFYKYFDYLVKVKQEEASREKTSNEEESQKADMEIEQSQRNLTTKIFEKGRIAYIRVDSFDDAFMKADLPEIKAFLEKVRDYDHLIIDIQNNGGGNASYWEEAFVRPNLGEAVSFSQVRMMKETELTQRFYKSGYQASKLTIDDVRNNPEFKLLHENDLAGMSLARELEATTEPSDDDQLFKGKKWVLIGPEVYSSAESFAVFCKNTGFATLVGQTTGGSNSGGPILLELPNSHLLVQFDVEYCLNADGNCSQEIGTAPDFKGEDALGTALDLIGKQ